MKRWTILVCALVLAGCASLSRTRDPKPLPYRYAQDGSVIWGEEFQFAPPPDSWRLMQVDNGDEFGFAFLKNCQEFPVCQSTFAYDDEPFGSSRELARRMQEFYSRFLWATRIRFGEVHTQETLAGAGKALVAVAEGRDEVRREKVWTKVVLTHRGERVVGFYFTQWRSLEGTYDPTEERDFDAFVASLHFIRPGFFETL